MKTFAVLVVFTISACAQVASKANENYKTKDGRDGVAKTLDNPNRDKSQKPEEIIAALQKADYEQKLAALTGQAYVPARAGSDAED